MAKLKLGDALKAKKVADLAKIDVSPGAWEKAIEMLEEKKPSGYKKAIELIKKHLDNLLEAEEELEVEDLVVEEEEPKKTVKKAAITKTTSKGGKAPKKTAVTKKEEKVPDIKLLGKTYTQFKLTTPEELQKACIPQTNVLFIVDEGNKEATIFTPVWVGEDSITLIDLSQAVGWSMELYTEDLFKGKLDSPSTEDFKGKLVATMIVKK